MFVNATEKAVVDWAHARNIVDGSTPEKQLVKLDEEFEELKGALERRAKTEIMDGIGDMMVVLTILARQCGTNLNACFEAAYLEIKDRKGRMIDGIFVKEADLPENQ